MSQITQLTRVLKQCLREHNLTYKQVAEQLSISEASVKRSFAQQRFSLERLEAICQLLAMTLSDLFATVEKQRQRLSQLTVEQENTLLDDPRLLLAAVCVRDGWSFEDIIGYYAISETEAIRLLARLDRLKLIELLPDNRYRLLIAQDFR